MNNIYCSQCGFKNDSKNKFCANCGSSFTPKTLPKKIAKEDINKKTLQSEAKPLNNTKDKDNVRIFWFIVVVIILIVYYLN